MEDYVKWGAGCVGRTEQEVASAVVDSGGSVRVVERDGVPVAATPQSGKLTVCASLTVANGLVTGISFA